jgi:hypothetical protein
MNIISHGQSKTGNTKICGRMWADNSSRIKRNMLPNTYYIGLAGLTEPLKLNLNSVNQLIFVMVKCGVLFRVRTEFLNNI